MNNPFIKGMAEKNMFSLSKADYKSYKGYISPMGAAFFIVPFINATVRSGTMEEKQLVFNAMLIDKSQELVNSTKRGHKAGETETVITQALRTVTNIKNRQTKEQNKVVELLDKIIEENDMLSDNALIFYLPLDIANPNIIGLIANKIMDKRDRPVCIMLERDGYYAGSARGCTTRGMEDFRAECLKCDINFAQGHENAFGISVAKDKTEKFKTDIQKLVPDVSSIRTYLVDYIFDYPTTAADVERMKKIITDIAELNDYWGTYMPRSKIALQNFVINNKDVAVYRKTTNTLKVKIGNSLDLMMFDADAALCDELENGTNDNFVFICECTLNEFNGNITPQLKVVDYYKNKTKKWIF